MLNSDKMRRQTSKSIDCDEIPKRNCQLLPKAKPQHGKVEMSKESELLKCSSEINQRKDDLKKKSQQQKLDQSDANAGGQCCRLTKFDTFAALLSAASTKPTPLMLIVTEEEEKEEENGIILLRINLVTVEVRYRMPRSPPGIRKTSSCKSSISESILSVHNGNAEYNEQARRELRKRIAIRESDPTDQRDAECSSSIYTFDRLYFGAMKSSKPTKGTTITAAACLQT
ncbi:hypothetical protein T4B_3074 [Trichinella pseudospiralis]|uniref:Uncharacterized protein n=1 Tax=Trichinella pseudospiralis TaxID=6337 RepID=A0A0V1IZ49_TRIPS|nr:hypothetical protein T4B_3074 [Trichinella pseudospiralis]